MVWKHCRRHECTFVFVPFNAPKSLPGVKIVPFTEYMDERLSYVLLMGAYIELEVRGASIIVKLDFVKLDFVIVNFVKLSFTKRDFVKLYFGKLDCSNWTVLN